MKRLLVLLVFFSIGLTLVAQETVDQKVDLAIPLVTFGDNRTVKSVKFNDGLILQLKLVINILRPQN
jgi:hypothetical protein